MSNAMIDEVEEVRKTAQAFFDKMAAWEVFSVELVNAEDYEPGKRRDPLVKIFSEHLTKSAFDRKPSRRGTLTFTDPPTFTRPIRKIEPGMPGSYLVYTATPEVLEERFCFEYEDGAWRVDHMDIAYATAPGVWGKWLHI